MRGKTTKEAQVEANGSQKRSNEANETNEAERVLRVRYGPASGRPDEGQSNDWIQVDTGLITTCIQTFD